LILGSIIAIEWWPFGEFPWKNLRDLPGAAASANMDLRQIILQPRTHSHRRTKIFTLLAGLSLLLPAVVVFLKGGDPGDSVIYPHPVLVLIPMFLGMRWVAFAVPTVFFFAWNPGLFSGESRIPRRSYILLIIASVLSVLWFAVGWKDGLAIQGAKYNHSLLLINTAWVMGIWALFERCRRTEPSFYSNLLLHWLLFAWLAWYAFPFFGEML
jgi:hypothetical protein